VVVPRLCENYVSPRGPGKKPWGENKMAAFFFSELRIIRVFFFRRKKKGKNENNMEEWDTLTKKFRPF
jgi:hypothetical protein